MEEKGLVILFTGDGKGKTSAAMGTALRCVGWGKRVCVIQFLKSEERQSGEKMALESLGVEFYRTGAGFTWTKTEEDHRQGIKQAWELAQNKLSDGSYDLIVLDELCNIFSGKINLNEIITVEEVAKSILSRNVKDVVITGRNAPSELMNICDTISDIQNKRHHFENGVQQRKGIEY